MRIFFVSSHSAPSGNYNNKTINLLAKSLKSNININQNNNFKNIWISRSKSKHRKIKNESEILPLLKKFNFEIVFPEEMTFEEQIKIYHGANIIGGLHGGGLTNILFMNPGTKLLEVRRENDNLNNCYYTLASELGINYYYVNSKSQGDDLYVSDTIINLIDLEKQLIKSYIMNQILKFLENKYFQIIFVFLLITYSTSDYIFDPLTHMTTANIFPGIAPHLELGVPYKDYWDVYPPGIYLFYYLLYFVGRDMQLSYILMHIFVLTFTIIIAFNLSKYFKNGRLIFLLGVIYFLSPLYIDYLMINDLIALFFSYLGLISFLKLENRKKYIISNFFMTFLFL